MWIYYPIVPSKGPATSLSSLKHHGRALKSISLCNPYRTVVNICFYVFEKTFMLTEFAFIWKQNVYFKIKKLNIITI